MTNAELSELLSKAIDELDGQYQKNGELNTMLLLFTKFIQDKGLEREFEHFIMSQGVMH